MASSSMKARVDMRRSSMRAPELMVYDKSRNECAGEGFFVRKG